MTPALGQTPALRPPCVGERDHDCNSRGKFDARSLFMAVNPVVVFVQLNSEV